MNRNVIIVLVGGFLIAVLVAVLVQASLGGKKKAEPTGPIKEAPTVQIVVASKNLKMGQEVTNKDMKWQKWPQNAVFPGALLKTGDKKTSDLISGRLIRDVAEGEPLVTSAIVPEKKGNFLAAILKPGMRAVSIDTKGSAAVAGFVGPGDFVDVILTYKEKIKYDRGDDRPDIDNMIDLNLTRSASETILQNIRVLAIDQSSRRNDDEGAKAGKTVTLEVDLRGAEILALAQEMGSIKLTLRKLGDESIVERKGQVVTDARITHIADEVFAEIEKMESRGGVMNKNVRIYSGASVQNSLKK